MWVVTVFNNPNDIRMFEYATKKDALLFLCSTSFPVNTFQPLTKKSYKIKKVAHGYFYFVNDKTAFVYFTNSTAASFFVAYSNIRISFGLLNTVTTHILFHSFYFV